MILPGDTGVARPPTVKASRRDPDVKAMPFAPIGIDTTVTAYIVIPLVAAVACTAQGCVMLAMGLRQRTNQLAACLMFGTGYWAFCEVLWNAAPDPMTALWLQRLSGPGWLFIGPVSLHLVLEAGQGSRRTLRSLVLPSYALASVFLILTWTTPLMLSRMQPTSWGNAVVPGPAFGIWFGFTILCVLTGIASWTRGYRRSGSTRVKQRGPVIALGTFAVLGVASLGDALLPMLGVQLPRFGTFSLAGMGALILWSLHHYGFSVLAPEGLSRRILRTLPDGVVLTSLNGRVRIVNDQMGALADCPPEELLGELIVDYVDYPLLESPEEPKQAECNLRRVSGESIPVECSSAPHFDNSGAIAGVVVTVRDIREVVALRRRLMTSGRLAAVGELAAGIAHEINNPLAFVRANLGQLQRAWGQLRPELEARQSDDSLKELVSDWQELIDESVEGVDRAATIVRDVKEFSHAGGGEREMADVNQLLDQVLRVASVQLGEGIRVTKLYGELPLLLCAPQRLKQLFLNLVVNAAQAIEGEGVICVRTEAEGEMVIVTVKDDGRGIESDLLERIFDPFFTTKPVGVGVGVGLSISHEIVRSHRGSISVESEPGRGTAFHVRLPPGLRAQDGVGRVPGPCAQEGDGRESAASEVDEGDPQVRSEAPRDR